jgi:pimeloyl-ACP methyl ester carboxylesterase
VPRRRRPVRSTISVQTCPGIMPDRLFPLEMAQKYGALVVTLEHRFFGLSQPFANDPAGSLATQHLKYSNSKQAVADLAHFTNWFQQTQINGNYSLPADTFNTWVSVGGSYPGALASWYRLKFPQFTAGSHSASGVVRAILNFTEFDQQVAASAGPVCADALRQATSEVEAAMPQVKALFGAQSLLDGDFFYLVADAAAEAVQYAHKDELCSYVVEPFVNKTAVLPSYLKYVNDVFYAAMGNSASEYDTRLLADPVTGGDGRSWWWFKCSELGYWQIAPATGSIRSQQVSFEYHQDVCARLFNRSELPDIDGTNEYYGGNWTVNSYTFLDNGVQDPWRWAGVQSASQPTVTANVIDCDGCAHCQSLYTPTPTDPPQLQADREMLEAAYSVWMSRKNGP